MRLRFPNRTALTALWLLGCVGGFADAFAHPNGTPPPFESSAAVAPEAPASNTPEISLPDDPADAPIAQTDPPARIASPPAQPPPTLTAALPPGASVLDSATVQRIADRLLELHFLPSAADAQNPDAMAQAIRDFQTSVGISPSGTLDRDTVGRLTAS